MIEVLFESDQAVVCVKPAGVQSQEAGALSMPALLRAQLGCPEIFPVHRLDVQTGGVMVYAKTPEEAARLSALIAQGRMQKTYLALLTSCPSERSGSWKDFLYHDRQKNKTYVVNRMRRGVREAELQYEVLAQSERHTLVRVRLMTGRTHQIRAQFSARGFPLAGDGKYGSRENCPLALWAYRLELPGADGRTMRVSALPPHSAPWTEFPEILHEI